MLVVILCLIYGISFASDEARTFPSYDLVNGIMLDKTDEVFSAHHPNYVIGGEDDLKLQFSFRYRLLKKTPLFFGYTQKMFWDIYENSEPMRETNFQPEMFYRFIIQHEFLKSIDVGALHHSNGKAATQSRSLNQLYTSFNFINQKSSYLNFASSIQFFYTFDKDPYNRDIVDYIGFYKVNLGFMNILNRRTKNLDAGMTLFPGGKIINFDRGAVELNLKFSFLKEYLNPDILFQYYHGYAQNLLEYNKSVDQLRIGFIFYL